MNKAWFFGLIFSLIALNSHGQNWLAFFGRTDTNYIKEFERPYMLQLSAWYNRFTFYVDPSIVNDNPNSLKLAPNLRPQIGVLLGLKYISLSLSVATPFSVNNDRVYGNTKFFDFNIGYFRGFFGGEFYYTDNHGMYQNSRNGSNRVRTNAGLYAIGANGFYAFNHHKFSFRSSIKNQELQCKSAGSPVLMLSIGRKEVDADTALVQGSFKNPQYVSNFDNLFGLRITHFSVRPGYAYNFSIKGGRYFVSPALFVGAGYSRLTLFKGSEYVSINSFNYDLHSKLVCGYNHPKYYWNLYALYDVTLNRITTQTYTSFNNFFVGINVGFRFRHFLKKVDWL